MWKYKKIIDFIEASDHCLIYPQMGGMGLALTDYTMFEVYEDADKQLEIAEKIEKYYPTDFIYPIDFGNVFQHALGYEMKKPDRDFPSTLENRIKTLSDIQNSSPLNVSKDGLFPEYLTAINKISKNIKKPQMVACVGPLTLASELAGLEYVLRATVKDKEFLKNLFKYAEKMIIDFSLEAIENGAAILQISEPVMSILRPSYYEKELLPILKNIIGEINQYAVSALHVCGDTRKYISIMLESGSQILSLDQIMDMEWVMQNIPSEVIAAGNLDPVEVMLNGTYDEVYETAEGLLKKMQPYKNFMISFGCDCPIDTPIENMQAVISAVNSMKK